jgi:allatostatin receptor
MEFNIYEDSNDTTLIEPSSGVIIGDELKLGILRICLFSTFFVLGLIGNSLVLIGIGLNKGMQTPTNLLIFNLALADILFIIVCIPTTLFSFFGRWPFTEFGCKLGRLITEKKKSFNVDFVTIIFIIAQFINHLSAFMSIYLLVFMSIDRYLAVVHAIDSIANYRTIKNTTICIMYDIYFYCFS